MVNFQAWLLLQSGENIWLFLQYREDIWFLLQSREDIGLILQFKGDIWFLLQSILRQSLEDIWFLLQSIQGGYTSLLAGLHEDASAARKLHFDEVSNPATFE